MYLNIIKEWVNDIGCKVTFMKSSFTCVSLCGCCVCAGRWELRRRFQTLELELQAVISCLVWVLRTKLKSSGRPTTALNHGYPDKWPQSLWLNSTDIFHSPGKKPKTNMSARLNSHKHVHPFDIVTTIVIYCILSQESHNRLTVKNVRGGNMF